MACERPPQNARFTQPNKLTYMLPSAFSLLPCLSCGDGARAREEIVIVYLDARSGRPPPLPDSRAVMFLPLACCRQKASAHAGGGEKK